MILKLFLCFIPLLTQFLPVTLLIIYMCVCAVGLISLSVFLVFQIRVVNAFRMGLEADSFDKRSLSSLHSQHSLQNIRLQALKKSSSHSDQPISRSPKAENQDVTRL